MRLKKIIAIALLLAGCGGGTTSVGNPKIVTFGAVENETSQITIPLDSLGGNASQLNGIQIKITKNGEVVAEFTASSQFNDTEKAVLFLLEDVSLGDNIVVTIQGLPSGEAAYAATLDTQDKSRSLINCATTKNAAEQIFCALCTRLKGCEDSVETGQCLARLSSDSYSQLTDELGVPVDENSISMHELVVGIEQGTYVADSTLLDKCLIDIGALTCDEVASGYTINDPENFDSLENIVPGDGGPDDDEVTCGNVFGGFGGG